MKIFKKKRYILLTIPFLVIISFIIYTSIYYKADSYLEVSTEITIIDNKNYIEIKPQTSNKIGYIFYPGGKVEASAYVPILSKLAKEGITSIIVKMPLHLAVFGINRANNIFSNYKDINTWYIGGHSLGGSMACEYAKNNSSKLDGVILLAAYPTKQIDIPVTCLYGSNDQILNKDKLKYIDYLHELDDANHCNFGNYGFQKGDGISSLTNDEQQTLAIDIIVDFINKKES